MAYLEQRVDGKALVEFGAQAGESLVGEENIALDLSCDPIDRSRIAQPQCFSSLLKGSICVEDGIQEAICAQGRKSRWRRSVDVDGDSRLF